MILHLFLHRFFRLAMARHRAYPVRFTRAARQGAFRNGGRVAGGLPEMFFGRAQVVPPRDAHAVSEPLRHNVLGESITQFDFA
jgi:hypothetical protein